MRGPRPLHLSPRRDSSCTTAAEELSHPGKAGLLLTAGWRSLTSQGKAASGRKTKAGLQKQLQKDPLGADPLGADPWVITESLAWF